MNGCSHPENQEHLASCPLIQRGFWKPVQELMHKLGLSCNRDDPKFWITGILQGGKAVDKESAAFIFWAWRALYAESVHAHLHDTHMNLKKALAYTIVLAHSRIRAHGRKWRVWYLKQRFISPARSKIIARAYRNYKLYRCNEEGVYHLHPELTQARKTTLPDQ